MCLFGFIGVKKLSLFTTLIIYIYIDKYKYRYIYIYISISRASSYEYVYEFNSNKANIEASVAGTNATPRIRNMFSVSSVRGSLANGRFTRDTERKCVQDPIFDSKPLLNLNSLIFKSITIPL